MSAVSSRSSHETAVVPCPIGGCLPALTPLGALAAAAGWGTAVPGGGATLAFCVALGSLLLSVPRLARVLGAGLHEGG